MPYDLSRFSPNSFQEFVQAIALNEFGPGLQIYGLGPDGGRDATFEGRADYPSKQQGWNGYTIIQAKYRQRPTHDHRDADWLVKQIEDEKEKFLANSQWRRPEFYLVVSNVRLSAVPRSLQTRDKRQRVGGLEKVLLALEAFKKAIGCKAYDVWHEDKLEILIQRAPESLRAANASWITPSDLIWQVLTKIGPLDFSTMIARAVSQDLRDHRYTRLQDAGHSEAESTLLTDVFVDLPVEIPSIEAETSKKAFISNEYSSDLIPFDDDDDDDTTTLKAVAQLIERSTRKFACNTPSVKHNSNRIVLLGGPGQGKSTIGQFVAQYFQAQLLCAGDAPTLAPDTLQFARRVLDCAARAGVHQSAPFRIPIRILLPTFADHIARAKKANQKRLTLLDFIVAQLERQANDSVSLTHLRGWLGSQAWIFVLDGLDEVPKSANRSDVLAEVEAFLDELSIRKSDALIVVSTRPQGYRNDLDPKSWEHWTLRHLRAKEALAYAKTLSSVRLTEPMRRERVLDRLAAASRAPATVQLMISPLQVAILFTLVDLRGDVPTDRWNLFERYFSALRDREEGKGGPQAEILRKYRKDVEVIHQHAGLVLQIKAEKSGAAQSFFTTDQFKDLVGRFLSDEGHEGFSLAKLTEDIADIATERLVLLASRVENRIAFDVRSLQEFMAAAMLTAGKDVYLQGRLTAIVARAHWRHVVQIAASRCFSDTGKRHLADVIISFCGGLNAGAGSDEDRAARIGSRLALDLLADGLAIDTPRQRKLLFEIAISLLDVGPMAFDERLASAVSDGLIPLADAAVRFRTHTSGTLSCRAAWQMIFALVEQDARWQRVANDCKTHSPTDAVRCLPHRYSLGNSTRRFARELVTQVGPVEFAVNRHQTELLDFVSTQASRSPPIISRNRIRIQVSPHPRLKATYEMVGLDSGRLYVDVSEQGFERSDWAPFKSAKSFCQAPSKQSLANALEAIGADENLRVAKTFAMMLPWPIVSLLAIIFTSDELAQTVAGIRDGRFGDIEQWRSAERRWASSSVTKDDLLFTGEGGAGFDHRVAEIGRPSFGGGIAEIHTGEDDLEPLDELFLKATSIQSKRDIGALFHAFAELRGASRWTGKSALLRFIIEHKVSSWTTLSLLGSYPERDLSSRTEIRPLMDLAGKSVSFKSFDSHFNYRVSHLRRTGQTNELSIAEGTEITERARGVLASVLFSMTATDSNSAENLFGKSGNNLTTEVGDNEVIAFSAVAIKLLLQKRYKTKAEQLILELAKCVTLNKGASLLAALLTIWCGRAPKICQPVLTAVLSKIVGEPACDVLAEALHQSLDSRRSDIADKSIWERLGLPESLLSMCKDDDLVAT